MAIIHKPSPSIQVIPKAFWIVFFWCVGTKSSWRHQQMTLLFSFDFILSIKLINYLESFISTSFSFLIFHRIENWMNPFFWWTFQCCKIKRSPFKFRIFWTTHFLCRISILATENWICFFNWYTFRINCITNSNENPTSKRKTPKQLQWCSDHWIYSFRWR